MERNQLFQKQKSEKIKFLKRYKRKLEVHDEVTGEPFFQPCYFKQKYQRSERMRKSFNRSFELFETAKRYEKRKVAKRHE